MNLLVKRKKFDLCCIYFSKVMSLTCYFFPFICRLPTHLSDEPYFLLINRNKSRFFNSFHHYSYQVCTFSEKNAYLCTIIKIGTMERKRINLTTKAQITRWLKKNKNMSDKEPGYVYILSNPSFREVRVKKARAVVLWMYVQMHRERLKKLMK